MDYQATYRRGEVAMPALLCVVALMAAGIAFALHEPDGNRSLALTLWVLGTTLVAICLVGVNAFAVHRWTILADGLQVVERPKVPLMGLSRRAVVPFGDIAAIRRVEIGTDRGVDIVTRAGRRYRMTQAMVAAPTEFARPDVTADLGSFVAAIRAAASTAGVALPEISDGMSFWNTLPGLACLLVLFAIALVFAGAVGWAVLDGGIDPKPRSGYFAGVALALPVGAAYLLLRAWRRRRLVLASQA